MQSETETTHTSCNAYSEASDPNAYLVVRRLPFVCNGEHVSVPTPFSDEKSPVAVARTVRCQQFLRFRLVHFPMQPRLLTPASYKAKPKQKVAYWCCTSIREASFWYALTATAGLFTWPRFLVASFATTCEGRARENASWTFKISPFDTNPLKILQWVTLKWPYLKFRDDERYRSIIVTLTLVNPAASTNEKNVTSAQRSKAVV